MVFVVLHVAVWFLAGPLPLLLSLAVALWPTSPPLIARSARKATGAWLEFPASPK